MTSQESGNIVMRMMYKDFKSYFDDGKILVGGSFYYMKLENCPIISKYKDLDIIIDGRKEYDYIVHEIHDFYSLECDGFVDEYDGNLIGCVGVTYPIDNELQYFGVDLLKIGRAHV